MRTKVVEEKLKTAALNYMQYSFFYMQNALITPSNFKDLKFKNQPPYRAYGNIVMSKHMFNSYKRQAY
jgi:hypothetical protein